MAPTDAPTILPRTLIGITPINVGLNGYERWLVQCAAAREGISEREFITRHAVEAARRVIEEEPRRRR